MGVIVFLFGKCLIFRFVVSFKYERVLFNLWRGIYVRSGIYILLFCDIIKFLLIKVDVVVDNKCCYLLSDYCVLGEILDIWCIFLGNFNNNGY